MSRRGQPHFIHSTGSKIGDFPHIELTTHSPQLDMGYDVSTSVSIPAPRQRLRTAATKRCRSEELWRRRGLGRQPCRSNKVPRPSEWTGEIRIFVSPIQ